MDYCREKLGLNAEQFLRSSPLLFFSDLYSTKDKESISRYDLLEQSRMWSTRRVKK